MRKLLLLLIITLHILGCKYLGDPPIKYNFSCFKYNCGDGGVCNEESGLCECYKDYTLYFLEDSSSSLNLDDNYCISKVKQLIIFDTDSLYKRGNHKVLLSNYGYDIPEKIDIENKFLYYGDSVKVYDGFYLVDDYQTVKLFDNGNYEVVEEVSFNKKIKDISSNYINKIILFEDNSIEVYDYKFQNKLLEFSNGDDKIIKISPDSFLTQNNKFISYEIKLKNDNTGNYELIAQYIEELSPSLDLINNNCSLMEDKEIIGNNIIKCLEKDGDKHNFTFPYNFIKNDEKILFIKNNCLYTNKSRLYCIVDEETKVRSEIYIKTTNKDHIGSNSTEFCYLDDYLYSCISYSDMDLLEN